MSNWDVSFEKLFFGISMKKISPKKIGGFTLEIIQIYTGRVCEYTMIILLMFYKQMGEYISFRMKKRQDCSYSKMITLLSTLLMKKMKKKLEFLYPQFSPLVARLMMR